MSFDDPADNKAFKEKFDFPYPLLSDPSKSVGTNYGVLRDPSEQFADFPKRISYLISPEGIIVKSYEVADPAGHAEAVLEDLIAAQQ